MVAIKLTNLTKRYRDTEVIAPLNLTLPDQQITALIGPSGSGKSTLLNMLAGLTQPTSGQISFDQQVVFDSQQNVNVSPANRGLAMVFQDFALWPHMTVAQNVAFALETKLSSAELTERVAWALDQVGLNDLRDRYPRELSGGQQQRVALARAIAVKPKLILFDEALSALDPQLRASLQGEISNLIHDNHLTAVFVTHDRQEALRIGDHVVLIHDGAVAQSGRATELYQHPQSAFAASFIGPVNEIDAHTAVRPEHVQLVTNLTPADAPRFSGQILSSAFIGDHFDTLIQVGDHQWHVNTLTPCQPAPTQLAVDSEQLITY
ncbi:ABC transporter ATP-binding protein [Lactiplantibacillus garii]|uniref:ABC-type quaternary amine transporter n=1 Tax=Lactiplantibacillus garii TaxID=2306423 RepID=A0A3R8LKN5_9LACO|nr:ABC transporter ATP-binding protein [Lactiplantibacillus garii]RRK10881.1 ABC transporter ATP-binding protein [Lactiplantibacillus garii]